MWPAYHPFAGAAYPCTSVLCTSYPFPPRVNYLYDYISPLYVHLHYYIMHYSKYDISLVQPRWNRMLPLQHMSPKAAVPNWPFSLIAQCAIIHHFCCCCHHPTTMTGHKDGSHKKRITTRKQDTDEKRVKKKLRTTDNLEGATSPLVVTCNPDSGWYPGSFPSSRCCCFGQRLSPSLHWISTWMAKPFHKHASRRLFKNLLYHRV